MSATSTSDRDTPQGTARIVGTGLMPDHIRAFAWENTPLGPIATWSEALVSTVNQMLSSPGPVTLIWGDDFTTFYNEPALESLGNKHPAALGASYREVFSEAWAKVAPEVEFCYREGKGIFRDEVLTPVHKGGAVEDHYWTYSRVPIHDHGKVCGVLIPHRNTTRSVLLQRERDRMGMQMAQFLSVTRDAVFGVDRDWRISYLNEAAETTYRLPADVVGSGFWEHFPTQGADSPFAEACARAMNQGLPGSLEVHCPLPLDIWVQFEVYGTGDGIVLFSRNVTERRLAEAALIQSEKLAAVGRMASSIAHEINNPLESVTNLLYIARHSADHHEIYDLLDLADSELRRVAVITNQTLRFHRQTTSPQDATGSSLFTSVLTMYEGRLRNSNIRVEKRKREERPVRIFEGDIRQVLNNLIGNAIDAMPRGGRLLVRSREAVSFADGRAGLLLTVADTGSGMPPDVLKRVFEAFYTTKGIGGSGLGLWISREIVDRHQGLLRIRSSQRPGYRGTVATLFLPFDAKIQPAKAPAAV